MAIAKKKKKFFDVEIPSIGKTTQLIGFDIKEIHGKIIKYDLTRILRGKNIILSAKVDVKEDEATATPIKIKILPQYLKRMVRKGTDYVEDSFTAPIKDNQVRIKTLLVTRRRVSKAVKRALREKANEEIKKYIEAQDSATLFDEIMKNKLQKEISLKMKKIYPLSLCEIRWLEIIEDKKE